MIYFDNAATGGFKPNSVLETTLSVIKYLNANPGRSGHRLSITAGDLVFSCRKKLSEFFNNDSPSNVIFTKNCTEALNLAIHGVLKKGDKVITSVFEHNSVLRPLYSQEKLNGVEVVIISPENKEFITAEDVKKVYDDKTKLVVLTSASNVTGKLQDIKGVGKFLKDKPTLFLVDGAQGAGHIQLDMKNMNIDLLSIAGHKGLYAISGSGALIINGNVDIAPTFQGGTGTESFNPSQPDVYPEKLESGTLNLASICSLEEGVRYVENNLKYIGETLFKMTEFLIDKLNKINGVEVYSTPNPVGIVAFKHLTPSTELSEILSKNYNIATRGGFHCAPLAHTFLNSKDDGLVRVSLSPNNTKRELNYFVSAIQEISFNTLDNSV